jgi:small ligand-binding sensory domain FIST
MTAPRFASALSVDPEARTALRSVLDDVEAGLDGRTPDLVTVFATHHHGAALEEMGPRIARASGARVVLGCTAESVIGTGREAEGSPGIALLAASLPDTDLRPFGVQAHAGEEGSAVFSDLPPVGETERSSIVMMADPFTFPVDPFLHQLNERFPGVAAVGGLASGAMGPGQTLFFTADGVSDSGCVGVVVEGTCELVPVVSQGCRPVGKPWVVTDCERNVIRKLGGRPALEALLEALSVLPPDEQQLFQRSPFLGLAVDARRSTFERGDFLARAIMGTGQRDRTVAVADFVRRGQTVQLLVRDACSAGEDLRALLTQRLGQGPHEAGVLLFSCNGRGSRMFDVPDHDAACIATGMGAPPPLAGFFAAGEIGPIGQRNFMHGFTAALAVLRARG